MGFEDMKKSRWHGLFLLAFALGSLTGVARGEDKVSETERNEPARYTSVQRLPDDITLATLSNGLTVIVQENHFAPVATVRCFVKNTGSAYESKHLGAGLSHVLEHVVAGGTTTRRPEKEIAKIIDTFGGATNAATSTDMTMYYIDCPAKESMMAIELLADAMQHVKFEPAEFNRELRVVRRELADGEADRERMLWEMLQRTVYTVHPARYPVIGFLDVLNATTNQTIIDFYRDRYVPNNQVFVVVGDVRTEAVLAQVAKQFSGTPRGRETYVPFEDEPAQLSPREAIREMEGVTYDLAFAWPTVKLSHPDLFALDVAAAILGDGESSRLVERVRNQQQLVLSVGAMSDTPHYVAGTFVVMASSRPETWQKASESILADVYRLREELVSPAELEKAKNQKATELVFGRQTVKQMADSLGRNLIATGDPLFDKAYVAGIQQVTAAQVRDVARRYLVPQRLNRVVIAPPGGSPKMAEDAAKTTATPIRAVRLANGLRVLLKRDSRLPLVNIQAMALGGSLVDSPKTAGRAAMVGYMLERGTREHSAQQIAEYFDAIGGRLTMGGGRFTVSGSATVLSKDFAHAAGLFAECFTQSTFPEEEFVKVQRLMLGQIAARADDPMQEISEFFFESLPAETPYHVIPGGTAESVQKLTAEDLRAYQAGYFVPENMVVAVFGDIDLDAAQALVTKHFGTLKAGQKPSLSFQKSNAIEKTIVRHKATGKPTGLVWFGYPTASIFDKKDYAAMSVLDAILSGYSYPSGWLHNELRGEGLVYWVHASQLTGPAPGYFTVAAQTQPEKIDEVVRRIEQNIGRAKQGQISPDEFATAVKMIIALHAQQYTTIGEQAQRAAVDELFGLGYDYDKTFDERISAVTLEEVRAVARKYLGNHVLVTASPDRKE